MSVDELTPPGTQHPLTLLSPIASLAQPNEMDLFLRFFQTCLLQEPSAVGRRGRTPQGLMLCAQVGEEV